MQVDKNNSWKEKIDPASPKRPERKPRKSKK